MTQSDYQTEIPGLRLPPNHKLAYRIWDDTSQCRTPLTSKGFHVPEYMLDSATPRKTLASLGEVSDYVVRKTESPWISGTFDPLWAVYSIAKKFASGRRSTPDEFKLSTFHVQIVLFGYEGMGDGAGLRECDFSMLYHLDNVKLAQDMIRAQSQVLIYGGIPRDHVVQNHFISRYMLILTWNLGFEWPELFPDGYDEADGPWYDNLCCPTSRPYCLFVQAVEQRKKELDSESLGLDSDWQTEGGWGETYSQGGGWDSPPCTPSSQASHSVELEDDGWGDSWNQEECSCCPPRNGTTRQSNWTDHESGGWGATVELNASTSISRTGTAYHDDG